MNDSVVEELPPPDLPPLVALIVGATPTGTALREWAEQVLPLLLENFILADAKGMGKRVAQEFNPAAVAKLVRMGDQSLFVHILNGALAAWGLAKNLSDLEARLFLAGFTLHDLNKFTRELKDLRLDGAGAELYRQALGEWAERLGVFKLIGREYTDDLAFLAQNAEAVRGENQTLANFPDLATPPEELYRLADLVRFADLAASLAKHPEDLPNSDKVRVLVHRITGGSYRLGYHRLSENRGLLSQAVHNGAIELAQGSGWEPFLFFPDGVTYLVPAQAGEWDRSALPGLVREALLQSQASNLAKLVERTPHGIKPKPELIELASVRQAAQVLIRQTFRIIGPKKKVSSPDRRDKLQQNHPELVDLGWDWVLDLRTDQLAEGLSGLARVLEAYYPKKKDTVPEALLDALNCPERLAEWQRVLPDGGVPYNWYYLAGNHLKDHPGLDEVALEELLLQVAQKVIQEFGPANVPEPFQFLEDYLNGVFEDSSSAPVWDFAQSLERYQSQKAPGRRVIKAVCAVCAAPFPAREENSSYTNRLVTNPNREAKRAICKVCEAERLLRQGGQGNNLEGRVYLHLYPNYFFTPETATVFRRAYDHMAAASIGELIKPWKQAGFKPEALAQEDIFKIEAGEAKLRFNKVSYPEGQFHGYYFLAVPYPGRNPSESETWALPLLYALCAPVIFGVKAVLSPDSLPPFASGADFPETVIIKGGPAFLRHILPDFRFHLDELPLAIPALFGLYDLTYRAYADSRNFANWNALNRVGRDLETSLLNTFSLGSRIAAKGKVNGLTPALVDDLFAYYQFLSDYYQEDEMAMIQGLVDRYAKFYRASGFAAYARLRPLGVAADAVIDSPPQTAPEDLKLMIEGQLLELTDRIMSRQADGFIPAEGRSQEVRKALIEDFAQYFLDEVFYKYAQGERALLRKHIGKIRDGAEAYYVKNYSKKKESENV